MPHPVSFVVFLGDSFSFKLLVRSNLDGIHVAPRPALMDWGRDRAEHPTKLDNPTSTALWDTPAAGPGLRNPQLHRGRKSSTLGSLSVNWKMRNSGQRILVQSFNHSFHYFTSSCGAFRQS